MHRTFLYVMLTLAVSCQRKPAPTEAEVPVLPPIDLVIGILVWDSTHLREAETPSKIFTLASQQTPHAIQPTVICMSCLQKGHLQKAVGPGVGNLSDTLRLDILLAMPNSLPPDTANLNSVITLIRSKSASAAYLIGVGEGVEIFQRAGLLNGHYFTASPEALGRFGSDYPNLLMKTNYWLVHDRRLITATLPSEEVALYLVQLLYGGEPATKVAQQLGLQWPRQSNNYFIAD